MPCYASASFPRGWYHSADKPRSRFCLPFSALPGCHLVSVHSPAEMGNLIVRHDTAASTIPSGALKRLDVLSLFVK